MAGGEPVRIYLLNKDGLNVGGATAAVLGERILDALFLLVCVPFAFFIYGRYLISGILQIGLCLAVIMFILVLIVFAYTIKKPEKTKRILIKITQKLRRLLKKDTSKKIIHRVSTEIDNFHDTYLPIYILMRQRRNGIILKMMGFEVWKVHKIFEVVVTPSGNERVIIT